MKLKANRGDIDALKVVIAAEEASAANGKRLQIFLQVWVGMKQELLAFVTSLYFKSFCNIA
jgi:hypothetical protein